MSELRPTAQLTAEHDRILVLLDVLDALAKRVDTDETTPVEARGPLGDRIESALNLVRQYADGLHHAKEEEFLFPRLEAQGVPREGGPLGCMLREHEAGRALVKQMQEGLETFRAEGLGLAFAAAASTYTDLLRGHINKENMALFPMAEHFLGEADKQAVLESFAEEESKFGHEVLAELLLTLDTLAAEFLSAGAAS